MDQAQQARPTGAQVGDELARFELPVDASKARELARALGADEPNWSAAGPSALTGRVVVPTFTVVASFWSDRQRLITQRVGLDLARVLHGGERWTYHRPMRVGDLLQGVTRLTGDRTKQGRHGTMRFITLTTAFTAGGEPVVDNDSTIIELERQPAREVATPPAPAELPVVDPVAAPWVRDPVTRTDIVRYAGAGGDFNPIHHDDTLAQQLGLPSVFAMGMLPAGVLGVYVTRLIPPEDLAEYEVRFRQRVWPGDELRYVAYAGDGGGLDLRVLDAAGSAVVTGSARVREVAR